MGSYILNLLDTNHVEKNQHLIAELINSNLQCELWEKDCDHEFINSTNQPITLQLSHDIKFDKKKKTYQIIVEINLLQLNDNDYHLLQAIYNQSSPNLTNSYKLVKNGMSLQIQLSHDVLIDKKSGFFKVFMTLNPLEMENLENPKMLHALFNQNLACVKWIKNTNYKLTNPVQIIGNKIHEDCCVEFNIKLTHDLLPLQRASEISYRVVAIQELGQGGIGTVYPIECTMKFSKEHDILEYSDHGALVVKIVPLRKSSREFIEHEWRFSSSLGCEPPIYVPYVNTQYFKDIHQVQRVRTTQDVEANLVMQRIPGTALFNIVQSSYPLPSNNMQYYLLSSKIRYQITKALFDAFKHQLVIPNKMHGDFKLENIIIDLGVDASRFPCHITKEFNPTHVIATIIDFASAHHYGEPSQLIAYTSQYKAPEHVEGVKANEKIDIFSLAWALMFLWGLIDDKLLSPTDPNYDSCMREKYNDFYVPDNCPTFTLEKFKKIHSLVLTMMHPNPDLRNSIDEIIKKFDDIYYHDILIDSDHSATWRSVPSRNSSISNTPTESNAPDTWRSIDSNNSSLRASSVSQGFFSSPNDTSPRGVRDLSPSPNTINFSSKK